MVVAQRVKEAEITEQDSLLLTRNLLRIAIFNISYIRGLFPEKYFNDKSVPALEMKIKKLMPMDSESRRLIDWMEKGVYDALQKKYLKTLLFCICEDLAGPMIEEYAFSFSYTSSNSEEVSMNVSRVGNKKNGTTFKSNAATEITPDMMRSSACKMVRTLVQLMRTLDQMPQERTILMKLLYFEDVTPEDYEPPFFRGCTGDEANATWAKNPLKMEVGNVNSKHLVLALKVKSILDPCEDENDNVPTDEEVSLGAGSMQEDDSSSSDTEVRPSLADQYFVAPVGSQNDNGTVSEAETEDLAHEEEQISRVKLWLQSRHTSTMDLTDILSNFPEISVALTEDIVEKLLKEGFISKAGKDSYTIIKEKDLSEKICDVKEEVDMQESPCAEKTYKDGEDYMYMKALYHALPMDYVTIGKLQSKLDGKVNQATVRKLIDKMTQDGYLKDSGSRKLGKRVIHSESSNKKLIEVKKALDTKPDTKPVDMEVETNVKPFEFNGADFPQNGYNARDGSTYGGLHSIGSDLTRTRGQSEVCPNRSVQSGQTAQLKAGEHGNTPMSRVEPIDSMESGIAGHGADISKSKITIEGDNSRSTQDKRSRKASTVKDPILQYMKRQKSQVQ